MSSSSVCSSASRSASGVSSARIVAVSSGAAADQGGFDTAPEFDAFVVGLAGRAAAQPVAQPAQFGIGGDDLGIHHAARASLP